VRIACGSRGFPPLAARGVGGSQVSRQRSEPRQSERSRIRIHAHIVRMRYTTRVSPPGLPHMHTSTIDNRQSTLPRTLPSTPRPDDARARPQNRHRCPLSGCSPVRQQSDAWRPQESSAGRTTTPSDADQKTQKKRRRAPPTPKISSALPKSRCPPKARQRQRRANLSIGIGMGTGTGGARPPTRTAGSELKTQKSEGEADLSLRSSLCLPRTDTRRYERHSTPRALHSGSRTNLGKTDMDTDRTDAFLRRPQPHLDPRPALALLCSPRSRNKAKNRIKIKIKTK
jgi:hypothetical protein